MDMLLDNTLSGLLPLLGAWCYQKVSPNGFQQCVKYARKDAGARGYASLSGDVTLVSLRYAPRCYCWGVITILLSPALCLVALLLFIKKRI